MLYLVKFRKQSTKKNNYHLFESHTESVFEVTDKIIAQIINKHKMKVKNICLDNTGIHIKGWPYKVYVETGNYSLGQSELVLLCNIGEQKFKLVNAIDKIVRFEDEYVQKLMRRDSILNCYYDPDKKTYTPIDIHNSIKADPKFVELINKKYEDFKLKVNMLGIKVSFEYTIVGEEVKITNYTGASERIILPNFVTTICDKAFENKGITAVTLNRGLKYIGNNAFGNNRITYADGLPDTIVFVGKNAFDYRIGGVTSSKLYNNLRDTALIL